MKLPVDARTGLALGITTIAILGITCLSVVVVANQNDGVINRAQNVFNAVLPLFGTWVGTVLAYYFSRENFAAASDSTQQLVRDLKEERLNSTQVADVMVKTIFSESNLNTKVKDVLKQLANTKHKRLLILKNSGALEALLDKEGIFLYLLGLSESERLDKTLGDLLKDKPDLKQTPAYISEDKTLAEAKSAMEKIQNCKVILVTKTGKASDPVIGLLTNTDIAKHSRT